MLHVICTRLRPGHLSVRVGDSSRRSEDRDCKQSGIAPIIIIIIIIIIISSSSSSLPCGRPVTLGPKVTAEARRPCVKTTWLGAAAVCLFVWLVAYRPSNMRVYLRDGSAQTSLRAATLRYKLQIKLSISPSHSILTPGRPVPVLTL